MATIVNTRDVELQATVPRVTSVTIGDNIVIDQDNVSGLGLVLEGTRQIWLAATSQIFQVPKSGATSPSSITLTANVRNLTASPTLTIVPGSGTMSVTPVLTDGVFSFTPAQLTSDVITFRLQVVEGGKTYTDDLTVVKVREGADGITGLLTNESHTLPADSLGNVTSYLGANGQFKVFQGGNDVTTVCTFSVPAGGNPDSLTYNLTASGSGAGTYSVTAGYPIGSNSTTLTIRATFGTTTIDKVFTISKAKAGVDGATAKALSLRPSAQSFTFDGTGAASPATQNITFSAISQNLSGSPSFTATGYNASGTSLGAITLTGTGSARVMSLAAFGAAAYAIVSVTWDGFTDQNTIVRLKDGAEAVVGYLTNEAMVLATASDGTGGNYSNAGGTFKVFDGITDKTGNAAVTYSVVTSSNLTISIAATGVYTVTNATADTGTATLRAVYAGRTLDKRYTLAKSKQGTPGNPGSNGQRGSRTFYVALSGTNAVWSNTVATTAATVDGGPVLNDIVCEYNNSQNFSETRFWNGTSWLVINAVVDGNLVVSGTIGTNALAANSVTAVKVDSRGLSIKDAAGNIILDANTPLTASYINAVFGGGNLLKNSSFEIDTNGDGIPDYYTGTSFGTGVTITNTLIGVAGYVKHGTYSYRMQITALNSPSLSIHQRLSDAVEVQAGRSYVASIHCRTSTTSYDMRLSIRWYDSTDTLLSTSQKDFSPTATLTRFITPPFIAPDGAVTARVAFGIKRPSLSDTTLGTHWYDAVQLEEAEIASAYTPSQLDSVGPWNPITNSNIGIFMASAAIDLAQINTASIGSLSALSATIGTLRTATTGGRTEIMDNKIYVYDTTNALRVKIGYLL